MLYVENVILILVEIKTALLLFGDRVRLCVVLHQTGTESLSNKARILADV